MGSGEAALVAKERALDAAAEAKQRAAKEAYAAACIALDGRLAAQPHLTGRGREPLRRMIR